MDKCYTIPLLEPPGGVRFKESLVEGWVPGAGAEDGALVFTGDQVSVWEDEHILEMTVAMAAQNRSV